MRTSIWQQFSSNNSSHFTVVGAFETPEAAERAANEVRQIIDTLKAYRICRSDCPIQKAMI